MKDSQTSEENTKSKGVRAAVNIVRKGNKQDIRSRIWSILLSWTTFIIIAVVILCRLLSDAVRSLFLRVLGIGYMAYLFYSTGRELTRRFQDIGRGVFEIKSVVTIGCLFVHFTAPLFLTIKGIIRSDGEGVNVVKRIITNNPTGLVFVSHMFLKAQGVLKSRSSQHVLSTMIDAVVFTAAGLFFDYRNDDFSLTGTFWGIAVLAVSRLAADAVEKIVIKKYSIPKRRVRIAAYLASIVIVVVCTGAGYLVMSRMLSTRRMDRFVA